MTVIRSLIFVPTLSKRFLEKAPSVPCDAVILDLEASIPLDKKVAARAELISASKFLREKGVGQVFVRINPRNVKDMQAAYDCYADGVIIPSTNSPEDICTFASLSSGSGDNELPPIYPIIETPLGLLNLRSILDTDVKYGGVMFGAEDFVLGLGPLATPSVDSLLGAAYTVSLTAHAYGLNPYGIAGSLASFKDSEKFKQLCLQARGIGMVGCPAIHPDQVDAINKWFAPNAQEIEIAKAAILAFEEAGGVPITSMGQMIDQPIYERYRALIASIA